MNNSSLVNYKALTKHFGYPTGKAGRGGKKIDKIFVHHMAGILTVEQCGNVFKTREASAHYGIDGKGRIGQYVLEENAAWHCANKEYNQRSIGIELANDGGAKTNWHVSDKAIAKCIDLIVDICKRNGIKKINYTGNLNGNLCMHCWTASTSCPGGYLKTKFKYIAEQVNKKLDTSTPAIQEELYKVRKTWADAKSQVGAYKVLANAKKVADEKGLNVYDSSGKLVYESEKKKELYRVRKTWADSKSQKGAFESLDNAKKTCDEYPGYSVFDENGKAVYTSKKKDTPAQKIGDLANEYAYPTNDSKASYKTGSPQKAYKDGLDKAYPSRSSWGTPSKKGASCDVFVGVCIRNAGVDKSFPRGLADQIPYLEKSAKFKEVSVTASTAQDGDVIVYAKTAGGGHICIVYDGKIKEAAHEKYYPKTTNTLKSRLSKSGKKWVKVYRAVSDSPSEKSVVEKLLEACEAQAIWSKNSKYKWQANPTVEKSKDYETCVTFAACVGQRVDLIPSQKYIWHDKTGKVVGATGNFEIIYPKNKKLRDLKSSLKAGDFVMDGDKTDLESGSHIFILTGEWKDGCPIVWDQHSAQGKGGKSYKYTRNRPVIAIARPKGK